MFATFRFEGSCRGTQIMAADSPGSLFFPISEEPITPHDWECLDGTLFIDSDDQPWIVFCHEWVQVSDGEIRALRLSDDLKSAIGEPHLLFRASEARWAQEINSKDRIGYVADGPWMHRLATGDLIMLWSSLSKSGYTVGLARSLTGEILGPWEQLPEPIYDADSGHCMVFHDFDSQPCLAFHRPNPFPNEHPQFIPIRETGSSIEILEKETR
jgi:arabinan endo-1,5-alpha-L-arabinosidase